MIKQQAEAIKRRLEEYEKDEKKGAKEYSAESQKITHGKDIFRKMAKDERSHGKQIEKIEEHYERRGKC